MPSFCDDETPLLGSETAHSVCCSPTKTVFSPFGVERSFRDVHGHPNSKSPGLTDAPVSPSPTLQATGVRLGVIMQSLGSLGIGLVMAFIYSWKLTLVILAFIPFVALGGALSMKLMTGFHAEAKEGLVEGGKLASESFAQLRTIVSLGLERKFIDDYFATLVKPHR